MQPTGSARIERRLAVILAADGPIARHGRGSGAGASAKGGKAAPDCDRRSRRSGRQRLNGAKSGDIPVYRPSRFELVISLKAVTRLTTLFRPRYRHAVADPLISRRYRFTGLPASENTCSAVVTASQPTRSRATDGPRP